MFFLATIARYKGFFGSAGATCMFGLSNKGIGGVKHLVENETDFESLMVYLYCIVEPRGLPSLGVKYTFFNLFRGGSLRPQSL
jgi:hypothetical protein